MSGVDDQGLQGRNPEEASTNEPDSRQGKQKDCKVASAASKSIFVFCDGTGNEFATKDSLDGNSNVVKLYTALKLDNDQVAYYHPGVGTLGDPTKQGIKRQWSIVKGLAFGLGFEDNVLDAYRYLMQHYASGNKVYIFGFSRGAYTARALAGLLHGYGLLCRGNEGHIPYAWRMYTEKIASEKELNARTIPTDSSFRDTFSHRDFSIYFVGLWDTVSSVGWITTPMRLLDLAQNPTIQRGRHAVSIDERRCFYQDNLWGAPVRVNVPVVLRGKPEADEFPVEQDLLQVWFAGVHSDVGGSYAQLQSGLANTALEWMIDETRLAGAKFDETRVAMVLGRLNPPTPETEALAPLYEKPKSSKLHTSLSGFGWWLLEFLPHRYFDKDDANVRKRIPLGAYRKIPRGSLIHPSVKERLEKHPCYKPKNISIEDLSALPRLVGAGPGAPAYLHFAPKACREYNLREKGLVVFVVTVLEIGLPAYAVLFLAGNVWQRFAMHETLTTVGRLERSVENYAVNQWLPAILSAAGCLWVLLLVAGLILIGKLIAYVRKP